MLEQFYRSEPTARTAWRQAILMGANVRTYKFPLGAALLDMARTGRDAVPLVDLATAYAAQLVDRSGDFPQAPSSQSMGEQDFWRCWRESARSHEQRDDLRKPLSVRRLSRFLRW